MALVSPCPRRVWSQDRRRSCTARADRRRTPDRHWDRRRGAGVTVAAGAAGRCGRFRLCVRGGGLLGWRCRFCFRLFGRGRRLRRPAASARFARCAPAASIRQPARIDMGRRIFIPALSLFGSGFSGHRGTGLPDRRLRVHQRRRRAVRIGPDPVADQDEIGAGCGEFADFLMRRRQSRRRAARTVRPTIPAARRSPRSTAVAPSHRARRTARNRRRPRPRPSNRDAWQAAPTPAIRSGFRVGSASSMAAMPARCAPSAPARATSST